MSLTRIRDAAVRVIRDLPNRPTGTGHMSAAALKAAFDQAAENIKTAVNQMIGQLESSGGAAEIGFRRSAEVPADTVQDAIENVQSQIAGVALGSIPDGSITPEKMQAGLLGLTDVTSLMTFTPKNSNYYPVTNKMKFWFSPLLNMMFVTGEIEFTKAGTGYFAIRYDITGPFTFQTNNYSELQVFAGTVHPQAGFWMPLTASKLVFELDLGALSDDDLMGLDKASGRVSGWLMCNRNSQEV